MIKKLLVIDDEPDICTFICDVADAMGFSTAKTHNSLDFPLLYSNDLDCIVMDLSMPDMDGIELIRFLGDNQCNADIIVVSGMDESIISTANRLARDHGLNVLGSLSKPIKISFLEDILSRVSLRSIEKKETTPTVKCDKQDHAFPSIEEMQVAIQNKQIKPFFQPQISTQDDTLIACEALARWHHPERGLVPPFQFINFAEDNHLINDLTFCMFEQVLEALAEWQNCGINIGCSINFSAHSLSNLDLPDLLFAQAVKYGISTNFLTIEITENAVLEEGKTYLDVLTRLRMKGFKLSIDDFGTGYSSMKHLRDIPFNEVKIDRSFVMNVMTEESAKSIVQSTTNLAHTLSMSIVSEGVEDIETLNFLKELGSDLLQGYYFSPPLARDDFLQWALQWQNNPQK